MRAKHGWLRQLAFILAMGYTIAIFGWYAAYAWLGDGFWPLALLHAFAVYLFVPLPVAALLAWIARRRMAWSALSAVALLFCGLFGAELMPPLASAHADATGRPLTVMTYNVLYLTADAAPIAANIRACGADVVAFQEFTPALAQQLEQIVGQEFPYRTPLHSGCYAETAIWSRYPFRQIEEVDRDVRCRVRPVQIDFAGQPVWVVNVHAWPYVDEDIERSFRWRREQIALVLDFLAEKSEPVLLLGDLNSTPFHEVYRMVSERLVDAYREAGWGLGHTFPAQGGRAWGIPFPARLVRIDYVFHSAEWSAESAWVAEWDGLSDHRAVAARLRLRGATGAGDYPYLTADGPASNRISTLRVTIQPETKG